MFTHRYLSAVGVCTRPQILKKLAISSVVFAALLGCEAQLNMQGVEATLQQPIRRTDQILTMEVDKQGVITALGSAGLVLTGTHQKGEVTWQRGQLVGERPASFIRSTTCADGTQVALTFHNEVWVRSVDAADWQEMPIEFDGQVEDVACRLENQIWVSGAYSTLLKSDDLGASWEEFTADEDATLTSIQFVDDETGYAVGEFGMLLKSTNGGDSWDTMEPIGDDFYPLSVYFTNANEGWVSGVLGIIYYTRDGGESWERQLVDSHASIYGFFEAYERTFAFGDQGALLRLDGEHWVDQPSPELPIHYSAGVQLEDGNVLLVGGFGLTVTLPVTKSAASSAGAEQ